MFNPFARQSTGNVGRNTFRSSVRVENGDSGYATQADVYGKIGAVGSWWRIWQMSVPAQTLIRWGYGSPALSDNQGWMWFAAMLAGTGFDVGDLRLAQETYSGHTVFVVMEIPDTSLHTTTNTSLSTAIPTNRQELVPCPEKTEFPRVGQDSRIFLQYKPISLVAEDAVGFSIPITVIQ